MSNSSAVMPSQTDIFAISRVFDAPRQRLWKAWTDCKELKRWWGPKGFSVFSCKLSLEPGGTFHYGLSTPEDMKMWGKFTYREIKAPELLDFIVSFSDAQGGITTHPMNSNWPRQTLSLVAFKERGDKTELDVRWSPYQATSVERKTFVEGRDSMQQGWSGTFEQLEAYLKKA